MDPLSPGEYERLRRATRTHREDLVVRLCGEAGLRPAEVVSATPADAGSVDGTHVLVVDDRTTVLPGDLEHDLRKYVASHNVADDDPIVDVSARRVQMLVREVADRAASSTGDDRFRDVSTRSLREHFVVSRLRAGVDPRIVAAVAGFNSAAGIAPYLDDPGTAEVVAALAATDGTDRTDAGAGGDTESSGSLAATSAVSLLGAIAGDLDGHERTDALFDAVVERAASVDDYRYAWVARRPESPEGDEGSTVVAHAGVAERVVEAELRDAVGDVGETSGVGPDDGETSGVGPDDGASGVTGADASNVVGRSFPDGGGIVELVVGRAEGATFVLGLGVEDDGAEFGDATARDDSDRDRIARDGTVREVYAGIATLVERSFEAVRRRRRLVADLVTDLRFDVQDADAVVPALASALDATVDVSGVVPGGPGLVLYVEVGEATPQAVVDALEGDERVERARYVGDGDAGPIFELAVTASPARTLVDLDARVTDYHAKPDGGTLVASVPADADVRALRNELRAAWPDTALVAQETVEREVEHAGGFQGRLRDDLTDRQLAVLQSAYHGGYFQWPRESTGEELADSLDVAAPTLHNHLRVAQRKLLDAFFES